VHPAGSYCTDISGCTVNKTLNSNANIQQNYLRVCYAEFHQNGTLNVETAHINSSTTKLTTAFIALIFANTKQCIFAKTFCAEIELTLTKNVENTCKIAFTSLSNAQLSLSGFSRFL
jgi:hypothetical protein